jgi:prolyl-tRNA editing enzyme YbaK/EbsC (Cys-tRNA(Pro) deacylase)
MTDPLTPTDLAAYIAAHGIAAEIVPMAVETPTVPAAAAALGVEPGQIIKSLLFLVRDRPVLVIASGETKVDRGVVAGRYGVGKKQVKLADAATVLQLTGYPAGGVPPFGHPQPLHTLLDRAVAAWEVVYGGGGDDHTLLRIAPGELARVTGAGWVTLAERGRPVINRRATGAAPCERGWIAADVRPSPVHLELLIGSPPS